MVAASLGAQVTIIERAGLGGSAVLTDVVPSKTLIATVTDATLPTGQPVGDAAVAFSIVNPTGGGETVTPVVALNRTTLFPLPLTT